MLRLSGLFMCLSVCQSGSLSVSLSVHHSFIQSVHQFICLISVHQSVSHLVYLSVFQSIHMSVNSSVHPSVCLSSTCLLKTSYCSEQGTPDESTEKPRRRKKPKTPEPGIDGESAKGNLGYDNEGALDGEDVSNHHGTFVL